MIKVGFFVSLGGGWQGGANYFNNLFSSYRKHPDPDVKLVLYASQPNALAIYRCDAVEVHRWPGTPERNVWTIPRRAIRKYVGVDPVLVGTLMRHRVDMLSHVFLGQDIGSLGRKANVPALTWMPDFQHKRLPGFFSTEECATRDSFIGRSKRYGHLLLSSHSAEADFRRFYPELAAVKTHVLRFSCASIVDVVPISREELEKEYPVHKPYFFLPNQFWQHKNHKVVVEALLQTPPEIRVICTGSMEDYRDPGYVPGILEKIRQAGLEERLICLGKVPYPMLVSLMHHSIAVVQPSLFEGWSTTVEESKAMCKRIILSNIDVHLEQAPERGMYFSPDSPEELAECLKRAYKEVDKDTEESFARQRTQLQARIEREWVTEYARIVKRVCGASVRSLKETE
jgi:glycosyltransferase involved in cell wall biosynthesis